MVNRVISSFMINFSNLKIIDLEISNNCQASCPMCSRNTRGGLPNSNIHLNDWSLSDFKHIITKEVIKQVEQIFFCGNFGDPCMNNELPEMVNYLKDLTVYVHTNGAMRSEKWWANFARFFQADNRRVMFALDGLEDTHHLYRIGTTYSKVVKNAKAFIKAGGNAEWVFIRFKHNQHQVQEAMFRARDLGFKKFTLKDSTRFYHGEKFEVWDKDKRISHILEPPRAAYVQSFQVDKLERQTNTHQTIECQAKASGGIYIDAHYNLYPCSFLGHPIYFNDDPTLLTVRQLMKTQIEDAAQEIGILNTKLRPIKDILNSREYQTVWQQKWSDNKLWRCNQICGKLEDVSNWKEQFIQVKTL